MNLRRTKAVTKKEFLHILRDPRSLIMALAMPFLLLLLFGYALTLDVDRIPTLIYDIDKTPQSRELIEKFRGSRYFQIIAYSDGYKEIERQIDQNKCLMAVIIPVGYAKNLLAGKPFDVQILMDGSDSNTASIAIGYTRTLLEIYALELKAAALDKKGAGEFVPPVDAHLRVWYNHQLKSKNYIVPGLIAVIMMIISALLTSLTIAREWETGTMEQLLSTPLRSTEFVLGKMIAFFTVGLLDILIALVVGVLLFRVPLRGNPFLVLITSCIFLIGALCTGLMISASARQQLLAYQMGIISSFLPAFLLSGFIFAIENMPPIIQMVTRIVPARYLITILRGVFLKGAGVKVLWMEITFLLLYAGIVFFIATRKIKHKLG